MRTLFEKYLQDNKIEYEYFACWRCKWKYYMISPKDCICEFDGNKYNSYRYVTMCPRCGFVRD